MTTQTTLSEEAKELFYVLDNVIDDDGTLPANAEDAIQAALDTAYNNGLEEAAQIIEPEYEFEVFAKRRQQYATDIRKHKRGIS